MQYPNIIVVPGKNINNVVEELKLAKVNYKVIIQKYQQKTKLFFNYTWSDIDETNNGFELKDIQEGLKLSFFNSQSEPLQWDINYILKDWIFTEWNIDVNLQYWISKILNITLTDDDKLMTTAIINKCIHWETETLKGYNEALLPTFKHPEIQDLLYKCAFRKKNHLYMWQYIKNKLKFSNYIDLSLYISTRTCATTLELASINLVELIIREEFLKPISLDFLKYFIDKNYPNEFIKLVQRRDKESQQHAQILTILLEQFKKMYPFLNKTIERIQHSANFFPKQN